MRIEFAMYNFGGTFTVRFISEMILETKGKRGKDQRKENNDFM